MDALQALIDSGTGPRTVVSVIDGMGGVGKTALALHAAHKHADRFPDGQLYIDLAGFTAGRQHLDPSRALIELLHGLNTPPQLMPQGLEDRAAFYRDRLHGTRTLIVLDNAADERQVRPLLPGAGTCLVLITSRKRLTALDDALSLHLEVPSPAEAITILRRAARLPVNSLGQNEWLGGDDHLIGRVAELCGRLPVALLIAAALLRTHGKAWSLHHLFSRLSVQSPSRRLDRFDDGVRNLRSLFDVSYDSLTAGPQRLYRLLAAVPAPEVNVHVAASLLGTDLDTAEGLLEQLVRYNLLEAASADRYRMHTLLHTHACALVNPAEQQSARIRLFRYHQHTTCSAL